MSPDEFWNLSWYEWGLYLLQFKNRSEREVREFETRWEQTRTIWATLININSGKGKGVKPSDLIELSYDKIKKPIMGEVVKKFKPKL